MPTEADAIHRAQASEPEISPGYSYYVLGVLFTVYVFNFVDRQVLAILLQPIKQDLQASDTEMGLLVGFAFVLFYTFAGIPIARWADRTSRRSVIALGLAVWSAMTGASGLARSFAQLALLSFFPFYFIANMYIGPMLSMTQGLVKLRMRATASAILLFILNMVGLGAGSFVVGFLNDQLAGRFGIEAIRYSLLAVASVGGLASLCFLQASRTLADDLRARNA